MQVKTDIRNDEDITLLVHQFYKKVGDDERLGYIFNDVAQVEWDTHLPKMVDFWSNILFQTRRFNGRPYRKHQPLPIKKDDFNIWLGLWTKTVDELFAGEKANHAKEMAFKIASAFTIRLAIDGKFE
ncbi:MAG TPA: group III truncated hemoglobin [Balneolaceae bacterium]